MATTEVKAAGGRLAFAMKEILISLLGVVLGLVTYFLWFSTIGKLFLP
jgi:hypothetical protein